MYIRMIYHMPKAIGWHGDSRKIVKIFAILKKKSFLDRNFKIHEIKNLKKIQGQKFSNFILKL